MDFEETSRVGGRILFIVESPAIARILNFRQSFCNVFSVISVIRAGEKKDIYKRSSSAISCFHSPGKFFPQQLINTCSLFYFVTVLAASFGYSLEA